MTPCEISQLAKIDAIYKNALLLTVKETAEIIRTTGGNVAKMIDRGHFSFDTVRIGASHRFPVPMLAAWLCGQNGSASPVSVTLSKNTPSRVRTNADLKSRLALLKLNVEGRAQKMRTIDTPKALKRLEDAKEAHSKASDELFSLLQKTILDEKFLGL